MSNIYYSKYLYETENIISFVFSFFLILKIKRLNTHYYYRKKVVLYKFIVHLYNIYI